MNPSRRRATSSRRAFTLVELVVSAALMAVVLGAAYACMQAGFSTRKTIEPRSDRFQAARVALGLLTADLRSACPLHKGPEFLGSPGGSVGSGGSTAGRLDFATHHHTPRNEGEGDYASVSWFVEADPATGEQVLWRRRNPAFGPDPLGGGQREEILRGVEGFDLEFYDGWDWFDTWGDPDGRVKQESSLRERPNLTGMPKAVRVSLRLPGEPGSDAATAAPPPIAFEVVARLAVEETGEAAGGGSSTSTSAPTGNGATGTPLPGSR